MKIWIIIETPLDDAEVYVQAFSSQDLALECGAEYYSADCQERDLYGDVLAKYVKHFVSDLESQGVYYCDQSESVFNLVERDLIEAGPTASTKLVYVKCDKCEGYHAKQDKGDCEAFCYSIEQIDEKRDRLAATGSKKTIAVEA